MRYAILQTCVPHYRAGLFDRIASQLGDDFGVVAGDSFYDPSLITSAHGCQWYHPCTNYFLVGRRLLAQRGLGILDDTQALVVEANPRCMTTWKLLVSARRLGIRTAAWGHALGRGVVKMATVRRAMFSLADEIICYGYEEQAPLQKIFPKKYIRVAGNTVLKAKECAPLSAQPPERKDVLLLGRLIAEKKGSLLLKALGILQKNGNPIGAVIIGDGPDRPAMESFASVAKLENIRFTGELIALDEIRQQADKAFCMVSAGYAGLSLLHAQSMGLPFIYSPGEPNAPEIEIARDGWNCLPFKTGEAGELADRIHQMYVNSAQWLDKSDAFCSMVRKKYSIESMADQFIGFFRMEKK